jgi:HlyD family type I secretion membrane fusion protein
MLLDIKKAVAKAVVPPAATATGKPRPTDNYRPIAAIGLAIIFVTFGVFGVWAAFAPLGSAVIGHGSIAVESNRKTIQHLEGGIVRRILVREGDRVRAGQTLFELDPIQPKANVEIIRNQLFTFLARADRLTAERDHLAEPRFSPEVVAQISDPVVRQAVDDERRQFMERQANLAGQVEILNSRAGQYREQISGIDRQRAGMDEQIVLLNDELSGLNELYKQDLVPKPRLLALERERASLQSQIGRAMGEKAQALKAVGETALQARQLRQQQDQEIAKELADIQAQTTDLREKYTVAQDIAKRINVTSPVDGTAQSLRVFTEGAVIRSAEPMVDIVPLRRDFVINAQFSPNDVDSIHPGDKAEIRFPSFHSRTLPVIQGQVHSVSSDRLVDEATHTPYFLVILHLQERALPGELRGKLVAGMPAEVVVPTGDRSMLDYLFNPLTNALRKTMREK